MKRLLIYIVFAQALIFLSGCEKEVMSYKGREGIYFGVRSGNEFLPNLWPFVPYSNVDFARLAKDEVEFPVKVMITGPTKDYDRSFKVELNPDSTTAVEGVHYTAIKPIWTIPAGQISTNIVVRLKRAPDLQDVIQNLGLRLVANEHFSLSFPEWDAIPEYNAGNVVPEFNASLHTLKLNDIMVRPVVWLGSIQPVNRESGLMGVFSRKKMEFLTANLGLKYEDFGSAETMPMARNLLIASDAAAILIRLKDAGTPVLEADGRLMFIGAVPWTSYIGVPYAP